MNQKQTAAPYVLTNENVAAFWFLGTLWLPLATGVLTGNALTLLEQKMHARTGPPSHLHTQEEGFYVISGKCLFNAGGETIEAGAGTFLCIPHDTPHSFTVIDDLTHVLNFYLPAGFEHIIMSVAAPAQSRTVPAMNVVPMPPPEFVNELSREYGHIKFLGMPFVDAPDKDNMATAPSETNRVKPYAVNAADTLAYWAQDSLWTILATAEQTGGSYSLMEQLMPRRSGPPPHTHEQDEAIYVLDGDLTLITGSEKTIAKKGAFAYIPSHCVHSFRVDSPTARILNFYLPGGFERTITEFATPAATRTLPPADAAPSADGELSERQKALFREIGMNWLALPDSLRSEN